MEIATAISGQPCLERALRNAGAGPQADRLAARQAWLGRLFGRATRYGAQAASVAGGRAASPPWPPRLRADDSRPAARRRARACAVCAPVAGGHPGGDVGLLVGELVPAGGVGHAIASSPN